MPKPPRHVGPSITSYTYLTRFSPTWVSRCGPSGVHPRAVAEVESDRLDHLERHALGEDVRRGEHAGVLLEHGRRGRPGDLDQVALEPCPDVLAILREKGCR